MTIHRSMLLGLAVLCSALTASTVLAQGIPAVSGVLQAEFQTKVPKGLPPTLTLRTPDRPAAFYARCVFGSPEQEVVGESEALEAGEAFVLALPADTKARTAECAVVARFANGLSERKPVTMRWEVVKAVPEEEAETEEGKPESTEGEAGDESKDQSDAPKR